MYQLDGRTTASIRSIVLALVVASVVTAALPASGHAADGPRRPSTGVGLPDYDQDDADATIGDGGFAFVGQSLYRSRGLRPNESVELLTGDGEFIQRYQADADGELVFPTEGLSAGEYELRRLNGEQVIAFELVEQTLDLSFGAPAVGNSGQGTTVDVSVSSNRGPFTLHLAATLGGDAVEPSTLASILGEGTPADADGDGTDDAVALEVPGDGSLSVQADFDGVDDGTFRLAGTVPDTTGSDDATVTVGATPNATLDAPGSAVAEELGDVARIPVALRNTDRASVSIGGQDVGYGAELTAVDENGDGRVVVRWNTHWAGRNVSKAFEAAGADSVAAPTRTAGGFDDPSGSIPAAGYDVSLSVGGRETGIGLVSVTDPGSIDRSIAVMRARRALPADRALDRASAADVVAAGDWLVLRIRTAGIYGYVDEVSDLRGSEGVSVSVVETSPGPDEEATTVDVVNAVGAFRPEANAFLLAWNTSAEPRFEVGGTYRATFVVDAEENPHLDSTVELTREFSLAAREASVDAAGDTLRLERASGRTVSGSATLADGTELTVVLRGDDGSFERSRTVAVENGTFDATFDLSAVSAGREFTLEVREGGRTLAELAGVVVAPSTSAPGSTPSPTPTSAEAGSPATPPARTSRATGTAGGTPQSTGTPGFGPLAGVAALAAAALLHARRRR